MAVDNRLIKSVGSPEGVIDAPKGTFYINTQTSGIYVKIDGNENASSGWIGLLSKGYYTFNQNPVGEVYAPRLAYCYDETDNNLYVQLTESNSPEYEGWTPLTLNSVYLIDGSPYESGVAGSFGDIFIDNVEKTIYAYNDKWQKLTKLETASSDVMINLSQLLTNVTEMTNLYFDMFFSTEPMDLSLSQYDAEGNLKTYILPNRAKDRLALMGTENPNGNLASYVGTLYLDVTSRTLYIKTTGMEDTTGWKVIIFEEKIAEPLYVDYATGTLKIRTDHTPAEGSENLINSDDLYDLFNNKADKAGNDTVNFKVATPVSDKDAVNLDFIKNMITYDSNSSSLKITLNGKVYTITSVTSVNQ